MRLRLLLLSILLWPLALRAQPAAPDTARPWCRPRIYYGGYEPRYIYDIRQLPDSIRSRVEAHLKERVGEAFFPRFSFCDGWIVDIEAMHRAYPSTLDYKWTVYPYELSFKLNLLPAESIPCNYPISVDARGIVQKEPGLPDLRSNPEKSRLLPREAIAAIAHRHGIRFRKHDKWRDDGFFIRVTKDSFVWHVAEIKPLEGCCWIEKSVEIEAHTGRVLKKRRYTVRAHCFR